MGVGVGILDPMSLPGVGMCGGGSVQECYVQEDLCPGVRGYPPAPQTLDLMRYWVSPLLTPSGSHHTYGWQVGGMHPTEILSCYK